MPAKRTEAQREAARRNGAKSQGPVTPEGKAKCAANGHQRSAPVREAARRIDTLLEADNHAAYVELFNRYLHTFQPTNPVELEIVTELARCRFKIERGEALASSLIDLRIAADWDLNCHHHPPLTDTQHVALAYNAEAIRPGLPYLERQIERSQRHWVRLITTLERIRRFQRQDQNLSTPTTHYDPLPVPDPWAHQQDDDPPPPPPAPDPAPQKNQQANPSPADLPQNQQPPESVEEDQTQPSPGS